MPIKATPDGVALSLANKAITVAANAAMLDSLAAGLQNTPNERNYSKDWALDHSHEVVSHVVRQLRQSANALEQFADNYL